MCLVVQVKTVFTMKLEMCNYFLNGKYEDACMHAMMTPMLFSNRFAFLDYNFKKVILDYNYV